jgi:hypothetical protein
MGGLMAWIVFELDGTLLDQQEVDDGTGTGATTKVDLPVEGAVEAVTQVVSEGHKVSVWTSRFAPMPEARRQELKEQISETLLACGFPMDLMEIWTGTTKPKADVFIDRKAITFDDDWGLALVQMQQMLEDQGLGMVQPDDGSLAPAEDMERPATSAAPGPMPMAPQPNEGSSQQPGGGAPPMGSAGAAAVKQQGAGVAASPSSSQPKPGGQQKPPAQKPQAPKMPAPKKAGKP